MVDAAALLGAFFAGSAVTLALTLFSVARFAKGLASKASDPNLRIQG